MASNPTPEGETMRAKVLKALKSSIVKWTKIVRSPKAKDRGVFNCELCLLFQVVREGTCDECPVFKRTRTRLCRGTPYVAWEKHV